MNQTALPASLPDSEFALKAMQKHHLQRGKELQARMDAMSPTDYKGHDSIRQLARPHDDAIAAILQKLSAIRSTSSPLSGTPATQA
jgi:hypothetical protein